MLWHKVKYNRLFQRGEIVPRKGFYINNPLVLDKLDQVENQSAYVEELILNDVLKEGVTTDIKIKIESRIDRLFAELNEVKEMLSK